MTCSTGQQISVVLAAGGSGRTGSKILTLYTLPGGSYWPQGQNCANPFCHRAIDVCLVAAGEQRGPEAQLLVGPLRAAVAGLQD